MPVHNCDVKGCVFVTGDVGDAVQLGRHYAITHLIAVAAAIKPPNLPLPKITGQVNKDRFNAFQAEWATYKDVANLRQDTIVTFLAATMEDSLKREVLSAAPDFVTMTEKAAMDTVSVVAMTELLNLKQDHNEPIRRFSAKAVAKARNCDLSTVCPEVVCGAKVDITEFILKHMVINGLADTEVRKDVFHTPDLGKKLLADMVAIIEAGETASRAIISPSKAGPIGNPRRDSCGLGYRDNKPAVPDDKCLLHTLECESCKKTFKFCKLYQRKDGKPPTLKTFTKCKPCFDRDKALGSTEKTPDAEMGAMSDQETQEPNFGFLASVDQYGTETHANNSVEAGAGSMAAVFAKAHQSGTLSDPTVLKVPMSHHKLVRAKTDSFRWNWKNQSSPPSIQQMATIGRGRRSQK
jgi:hypothetical protein